jgi:hypothetical protein
MSERVRETIIAGAIIVVGMTPVALLALALVIR